MPKASTTDGNSIQMKIAEFLNRETNANANRSETSTTKASLPQKNTTQVGPPSQVRKPSKPATNPLVPAFMKNTAPSRPYERPTHLVRRRPEDRMVALKPVEIVLPPVMLPFSSPQLIRPQIPTQHFYCHWVGPKTVVPSYFSTPSISRKGEKPKENLPSSLLRCRRPWLWLSCVVLYRGQEQLIFFSKSAISLKVRHSYTRYTSFWSLSFVWMWYYLQEN